jgi:transcriptional regulator with XRE-family HTH domain
MNIEHNDTESSQSAAVRLGEQIRLARRKRGLTILELAEKVGRTREWLNRVELGYSEYGEYKPASRADVQTMVDCLGDNFAIGTSELFALCDAAQTDYHSYKVTTQQKRRTNFGKLTQTEVIVGEKQIVDAIVDLVHEQHSDAIIRNTGVKSLGNYQQLTPDWKKYRHALGDFLCNNPNALFKRVEYAATLAQLQSAKEADEKLAGTRKVGEVHNAKIKFQVQNPLQMHVVIGQREAILALPQTSGQAGSNIALMIRDKVFVEALRVWYDEVLWDAPTQSQNIDFARFDESFDEVKDMYGFAD